MAVSVMDGIGMNVAVDAIGIEAAGTEGVAELLQDARRKAAARLLSIIVINRFFFPNKHLNSRIKQYVSFYSITPLKGRQRRRSERRPIACGVYQPCSFF